jgi:hypothetical protein
MLEVMKQQHQVCYFEYKDFQGKMFWQYKGNYFGQQKLTVNDNIFKI